MSNQNKRIEDKIDVIVEHIGNIDVTIAKQQTTLDEHVRRSVALEAIVDPMRENMDQFVGAVKFIKILGILAGIAEAIHLFL